MIFLLSDSPHNCFLVALQVVNGPQTHPKQLRSQPNVKLLTNCFQQGSCVAFSVTKQLSLLCIQLSIEYAHEWFFFFFWFSKKGGGRGDRLQQPSHRDYKHMLGSVRDQQTIGFYRPPRAGGSQLGQKGCEVKRGISRIPRTCNPNPNKVGMGCLPLGYHQQYCMLPCVVHKSKLLYFVFIELTLGAVFRALSLSLHQNSKRNKRKKKSLTLCVFPGCRKLFLQGPFSVFADSKLMDKFFTSKHVSIQIWLIASLRSMCRHARVHVWDLFSSYTPKHTRIFRTEITESNRTYCNQVEEGTKLPCQLET